jgi:hypothetical protein
MFDAACDRNFNGNFADSGARKKSLVAFLRAIRFTRDRHRSTPTSVPERSFAQPHPRARQSQPNHHEVDCIRSAN